MGILDFHFRLSEPNCKENTVLSTGGPLQLETPPSSLQEGFLNDYASAIFRKSGPSLESLPYFLIVLQNLSLRYKHIASQIANHSVRL